MEGGMQGMRGGMQGMRGGMEGMGGEKRSRGRPGDWICPDATCANINFTWREECNKCDTTKPKGGKVVPNVQKWDNFKEPHENIAALSTHKKKKKTTEGRKIDLSGLSEQITEKMIAKYFTKFGTLDDWGKEEETGYVVFDQSSMVNFCLKKPGGHHIDGIGFQVEKAKQFENVTD